MTDSSSRRARAVAHANIALVKYWGKRDVALNLPCTGSLSMTLSPLATETEIILDPALERDELILNGEPAAPRALKRVSSLLDAMRVGAGVETRARVTSRNHFPTAAGLASSASAFAALVIAADGVFDLNLTPSELSVWARKGSGSAARSIFSGFSEMRPGVAADGHDAHAIPLHGVDHWPLQVVIALVSSAKKSIASTDGMTSTSETSPFFPAWCEGVPGDILAARQAIEARDFAHLAQISERSCLRMHASAFAADPGVIYWRGATLELIEATRRWRAEGLPVFFTVDAGPNVKIFCEPSAVDAVEAKLADFPGVEGTLRCEPGEGAHLIREDT